MTMDELRRFYAEEIGAVAHLESRALVDAFARVPREAFLDPGPWLIARGLDPAAPYRRTADADPRHVLHDVAVAIDPARQLNNGQPSALARWIDAADVHPGDAVMHVGAGTGYYTAILAELVGAGGRVLAFEVDASLAGRARANLARWPQVELEASDGGAPRGSFDAIFVNAGATYARREWLAALRPGGRLVIPLTVHLPAIPHGVGIMLRATRADGRWPAQVVTPVGIYDCAGARDAAHETELRALLAPGAAARIHAVRVEPHPRDRDCLAHVDGFCLAT